MPSRTLLPIVGRRPSLVAVTFAALLSTSCADDAESPDHNSTAGDGDGDGDGQADAALIFSHDGGLYADAFELSITTELEGEIRYTTDGSFPTVDAALYAEPIDVHESVEVRAGLFAGDQPDPPRRSETYLWTDGFEFESEIPIVVVETWGEDEIDNEDRPRQFHPTYTVLFEPGGGGMTSLADSPTFANRSGMHIRGNSTTEYPKKQYRVELWNEFDEDHKASLLDMPEDGDWILQAPYGDKSLMRNYLMYRWSNSIGRYAVRCRFVEVFVNWDDEVTADDYVGVYVLMEKIEIGPDRVAVTKLQPEDEAEPEVTGGYLIKRDWVHEGDGPTVLGTATYEDELQIEEPKPEVITESQIGYVQDYLDEFESALSGPGFADANTGYEAFADVDSFIDHHLLVELGRNVDGYVLSTFMHKDREGKLNMGPIWDYNGALGNGGYFEAMETEGWHFENEEFPADNPNGYHWYERMFEDPAFQDRYAARWQELREGQLADDVLIGDIDAAVAELGGAPDRNFDRWDILGEEVFPNPPIAEELTTYDEEIDYMKDWIIARAAWMDSQLQ